MGRTADPAPTPNGEVRVHLRVEGHVQGVFYRTTTQRTAREHGTTGWIRNRPDGTVELEVQGPADAVEGVVAFCRTGPSDARVVQVLVDDRPTVAGEEDFEVR